jgi:siroheme synthase (precorrin-2 oxidase/ferrochelatase)
MKYLIDTDKIADINIRNKIINLYKKDKDAQVRANKRILKEHNKNLKQRKTREEFINQKIEILNIVNNNQLNNGQ